VRRVSPDDKHAHHITCPCYLLSCVYSALQAKEQRLDRWVANKEAEAASGPDDVCIPDVTIHDMSHKLCCVVVLCGSCGMMAS
jgi:hypothetical protein